MKWPLLVTGALAVELFFRPPGGEIGVGPFFFPGVAGGIDGRIYLFLLTSLLGWFLSELDLPQSLRHRWGILTMVGASLIFPWFHPGGDRLFCAGPLTEWGGAIFPFSLGMFFHGILWAMALSEGNGWPNHPRFYLFGGVGAVLFLGGGVGPLFGFHPGSHGGMGLLVSVSLCWGYLFLKGLLFVALWVRLSPTFRGWLKLPPPA